MARSRLHRSLGRADSRGVCSLRRRKKIRRPQCEDRRSQVVPMWGGPEGRDQALAVQGVRLRLHPGKPVGRPDGVVGRRVLRLLPVWRCQAAPRRRPDRGESAMNVLPSARRRRDKVHVPTVTLAHGGGGKAMKDLIDDVFVEAFDNPLLAPLDDQARLDLATLARHGDRLAFTTDSFVVDPLIFPGGDIGKLAVCGTVNDLAVGGAIPLYLSCAVIVEEGVSIEFLRRIAVSMATTATAAGVQIVAGDTKIVNKAACDKMFITTAGIGAIRADVDLGAHRARPGDLVLVNGLLGDHGAAILGARGDLALEAPIVSDCAPLHDLT